MSDDLVNKLCSKAKLDRDRGYTETVKYLKNCDDDGLEDFKISLMKALQEDEKSWEYRHGGLSGARCLLENIQQSQKEMSSSAGKGKETHDLFALSMIDIAMDLLDHNEFRVRLAAGNNITSGSLESRSTGY